MDQSMITFSICRHYLQDHRALLRPDVYEQILGRVRARDYKSLAAVGELFSEASHTKDSQRVLRQIAAFFKKNTAFTDLKLASEAAINTFWRGEKLCRITNKRLDYFYFKRDRLDPDLKSKIDKAEGYVRRVLGEFSPFLESLPERVRITSGATADTSRRNSIPYLKVSKRISCTRPSAPYLRSLSRFFGYGELKLKMRTTNRIEIVPKNWKTGRTIACEPLGNLPLQLAFDSFAKTKLRRFGIDLKDQSKNQRLALEGSINGRFATIDLSMASDTLSMNTVAWLLPEAWFSYLNDIRSPQLTLNGEVHTYAKFSSMGNGATFALESLIFAALCHASGSKEFSVFGDDIIIEPEFLPDLFALLKFFGFHINKDKSFWSGKFRESCGFDCYDGHVITPFYIRKVSNKMELSHVVNGVRRASLPYGRVWDFLREIVRLEKLPLVPINNDTLSGVFVDASMARGAGNLKTKHWQTYFRGYSLVNKLVKRFDTRALFLWYIVRYTGDTSVHRSDFYEVRKDVVESHLESSRYTLSDHRFRRKWVHWVPPVAGNDTSLNDWCISLAL